MRNQELKKYIVDRILPRVQSPAQYMGGELNSVVKDHNKVRGTLCLAFPDTYTIGMSHHGLEVLYSLMNRRDDWACERAYTPWVDFEEELRKHDLPLYGWETFTPLCEFDVLGFTLQYEIGATNLLTMLDLGRVGIRVEDRSLNVPLVIAGGPCAQNPEPLADFVDLFVTGDGEPSLPMICDLWLELREKHAAHAKDDSMEESRRCREEAIAELASKLPFAYAPRFYEPEYVNGKYTTLNRLRSELPETIEPSVIVDLDGTPLPTHPIVPWTQTVHDRIAIEIMRGCPWQCRFCQSTVIKRPMRFRKVETIVNAALESYHNTGFNEISILSLSTSDYPHFEELVLALKEKFNPLNVNIAVPSLRVNEQLRSVAELIGNSVARVSRWLLKLHATTCESKFAKKSKNEDLYEGCRQAFRRNYESVKLYFMCGLPGERPVDLDGIIEMAETIAKIGKEERGRYVKVTASVSNFVPKSHTPYQWNGMQSREYFHWARNYLISRVKLRSVSVKCHDVETSLLEGVLSRGDRRVGKAIELAWQRGARLDSWSEQMNASRWWQALEDAGVSVDQIHRPYELSDRLPWDHLNVKYGRTFLEKEQTRSLVTAGIHG